MTCGIYIIENKINGKRYTGLGLDVEKRMWAHHKECKVIYDAIKKHGSENFKRYVVVYCEEWDALRLEIECIKVFHSHTSEWGYNVTWGGNAPMMGRNHSDKTRKQMSVRSGENNPHYNRRNSPETIKIMSDCKLREKNYRWGTKKLGSSSLYFGVIKSGKRYRVALSENGIIKDFGSFETEVDAAMFYDKHVIENNINRPLNFPSEKEFEQNDFYKDLRKITK